MLRILFAIGLTCLLSVMPVYAEVVDKEPTVAANWLWAVVSGGVAVVAWRRRWWLGALVSILALAGVYAVFQEINDPVAGPAIQAEAGRRYVTHFYWSAGVGVLLHVVAAYGSLRRGFGPRAV